MSSPARSLAAWLRSRTDEELAGLLSARPDLVTPVPPDLAVLAARATTRVSVLRALDRLDRAQHAVLEALCLHADPTPYADLAATLATELPAATVRAVVDVLRALAVVWGEDDALYVVTTARQLLTAPAGLGPPVQTVVERYPAARAAVLLASLGLDPQPDPARAAAQVGVLLSDAGKVEELVERAGAETRAVLDALTWSPVGSVRGALRPVRPEDADTPVRRALAYGLLMAVDADTVVLPREVGLALRRGRLFPAGSLRRPEPATTKRTARLVDSTAAGQAFAAIRAVTELLDWWGVDGPAVLRAGGLGVRELKRTAAHLELPEPVAALHVEAAYATGLLAQASDSDPVWLPTPAYDAWRRASPQDQWAALAGAWLATTRLPALVGSRDERDKPLATLGPELERGAAPELRRATLAVLAELPAGVAPDVDSVVAAITWLLPRRAPRRTEEQVRWALAEAAVLGVTGAGALSAAGRKLIGGDLQAAAESLAPLLPEPLDHVLLQADLTAVAPGPLVNDLAHELSLVADVESRGGATVYRFTESSVRRALDAGRSAAELHALLARHSRTPVPQPLRYLVDDVARRHGRIRVGTAGAYIRSDDPAVLTEVLASRSAEPLGLRLLAPTVLASRAPVDRVLDALRAAGHAPVAESADGDVVIRRPHVRRAAARPSAPRLPRPDGEPSPRQEVLAAAVTALRAGDRAAAAADRSLGEPGSVADTVALLADAVQERQAVWIGYLNAEGEASQRIIEPRRVEGGFVYALDHRTGQVRTFAVHRITGLGSVGPDDLAS